jgi:cystathionine beta-lyase
MPIVKNSLKWTYYDPDVLPAWVAEMDFGLAPSVSRALHEAVDRGDTGYPSWGAMEATASAATEFWASRLGWTVDPSRVFAVPDVIEGTRRAIVHLTEPGSSVILPTPAYYPFFSMVERADREFVEVPGLVDETGRYTLDLEAIDREMADGAGSVVLCNPWNPTGRSFSADELSALIEVVASHDGRILSDEIHAELVYAGSTHVVAADIAPDVLVTISSASKAFNLPGLKCAQVVLTNDRDAEAWSEFFTLPKVGVGTFGLTANTAAYTEGGDWLDAVMVRLESNRRVLGELIETHLPGVGYRPPEATYLAWLDFGRHGHAEPANHFLEHARVALSEGALFGAVGEGYARLNFATTEDLLIQMVEQVAAVLDGNT